MNILRGAGRLLVSVLVTAAKTLGAMGGTRTFDDSSPTTYRKRNEYRP
jgi:hypothetical protein